MKCHCCLDKGKSQDKSCIEKVPIFSKLSAEEILEVARVTTEHQFNKGEMIFFPGDALDKLYVIHQGKVKISRISDAGKEQIIRVLGEGDFLGELSLFANLPASSSAEAMETTIVCQIESEKIKELMLHSAQIAVKILTEISRRLYEAENLIETIGLYDVEKRVASAILKLAGNSDEVVLAMSKKDLALHLGISQETLSRKLSAFQDQGWLKLSGHRQITILDRQSLVLIAGN